MDQKYFTLGTRTLKYLKCLMDSREARKIEFYNKVP